MAFRERLREEIEFKGMLVKEVAAAAGISSSTFLSYIDARGVLPNVETAVRIAQTLGVSVEYLVTGKNENRTFRLNEIQTIVDDLLALDKEKIAVLQKMIHALVWQRTTLLQVHVFIAKCMPLFYLVIDIQQS